MWVLKIAYGIDPTYFLWIAKTVNNFLIKATVTLMQIWLLACVWMTLKTGSRFSFQQPRFQIWIHFFLASKHLSVCLPDNRLNRTASSFRTFMMLASYTRNGLSWFMYIIGVISVVGINNRRRFSRYLLKMQWMNDWCIFFCSDLVSVLSSNLFHFHVIIEFRLFSFYYKICI